MRTMAKKKKPLAPLDTPEQVRAFRLSLGLTIEQAADRIGIKPRTWKSWEQPSQDRGPSASHVILLRLLESGEL